LSAGGCSIVLRRFTGPLADELAILCRPDGGSRPAAEQAEAAYSTMAEAISAQRASFHDSPARRSSCATSARPAGVLAARARVLADLGGADGAPRPRSSSKRPSMVGAAFELSRRPSCRAIEARGRCATSSRADRAVARDAPDQVPG